MTMPCSGRITRGLLRKILALVLLLAPAAPAQPLETLAGQYRKKALPARRAALQRFAAAHPQDQSGALALLAMGIAEHEQKLWAASIRNLKAAGTRLPELGDYIACYLADSYAGQEDWTAAAREAVETWSGRESSPLAGRAALLAARAFLKLSQPKDAAQVLRSRSLDLPQPEGTVALGEALEAAADPMGAVTAYQRAYFNHPLADQADEAERALRRLGSELGDKFPPATAQAMLGRAEKIRSAGLYSRARHEFELVSTQVGGGERDVARVRMGVCDYLARQTDSAQRYLASLEVAAEEADAERLECLVACARRKNDTGAISTLLDQLARQYPRSPWRLEALITAADAEWMANHPERYVPLYRACFESFPDQASAAACHWRVTWNSYLDRRPEAGELLRAHLRLFPASEHAHAALYFLGRLEETGGSPAGAKGCFAEVLARYSNSYYAVVARQRLRDPAISAATAPAPAFLPDISFPPRQRKENFQPGPAARYRTVRAGLLLSIGFDDLAEAELRFGAQAGEQPHVLAAELAKVATRRGAPDQGIRYIKRFVPGYLWLDLEGAPPSFWRLAFPLPYRASLEKWAKQYGLDPFLLAGLIRQESEFNPKAVSRAKAYGLTQVLPRTGRSLARQAGMKRFSAAMLFQPDVNLHLGAMYLKALLAGHGGNLEHALASYNAGKSRTDEWVRRGSFREQAEFVETAPFSETRGYIQQVLRNADFYRRLYAGK